MANRLSSAGKLTIQLPAFATSACAINFTASDHEAIRYFRTTYAQRHHTKHPDYSVYSIMFDIAQHDQLVMYSLLALASREIESRRRPGPDPTQPCWRHLSHYSNALKGLADELVNGDASRENFNFDVCLTTLYIMLLYEQNFGDDDFVGFGRHMQGASMILRCWARHIQISLDSFLAATPLALCRRGTQNGISLYSARIIVWLSIADATAATYGFGGTFNKALHEVLGSDGPRVIESLHAISNPLFRVMWGEAYPQSELVDDLENRAAFELMVACYQARYALSQLTAAMGEGKIRQQRAQFESTKRAIQFIATQHGELLAVADGLLPEVDNSRRLVANLRAIAPHYHAVVIIFERLTANKSDCDWSLGHIERTAHINSIINLARQAYRHQGSDAMVRVAWPLFVVALEMRDTSSTLDWILSRFQSLATINKNFAAAEAFLRRWAGKLENTSAAWIDAGKWRFII